MKDLYAVLGVKKEATQEEIKVAYKALAQKNHPDKGGSVEIFTAIQTAYDVLGEPTKRAVYDRTGSTATAHSIEAMATELLYTLFNEAIGKMANEDADILAPIRSNLRIHLSEVKRECQNLDQLIDRLKNKLGRIKTAGEENLFENALHRRMQEMESALEENQKRELCVERVIEMLDDYKDEKSSSKAWTGDYY
jgi:curved DNA-binding protein CbpA